MAGLNEIDSTKQDEFLDSALSELNQLMLQADNLLIEENKLMNDDKLLTNKLYVTLCQYLKLEISDPENPLKRVEDEKTFLQKRVESLKEEIEKLILVKKDLLNIIESKHKELKKIEELKKQEEAASKNKSIAKFKVLCPLMNVSFKTDSECKATLATFKQGNATKSIQFEEPSKSTEDKVYEFWKILDFLDRKG